MEVRDQHHIGITVSDIKQSVAFYRDALGMTLQSESELQADWLDRIVGVPGMRIKSAYLTCGSLTLELFQYLSPKGGKQKASLRPFDVGNHHVAFLVDDIQQAYRELTAKGVRFANPPQYVPSGPDKGLGAIYFYDPDGITLELIQRPK